jgi:hypothetical protein
MHTSVRVLVAAAGLAALPFAAQAKVHITVDLSRQMMHVESANETYDWPVSSGKFGFETPNGTYGVLWTDKDHHSQEYDNAPMPDAIFFRPGYAIHGAYKSDFGHPASHGCVRLPVAKAEVLFDLVKAEGAQIKIIGESPPVVASRRKSRPPVAPDDGSMDPAQSAGVQDYGSQGYAPAQRPRQAYQRDYDAPPPGYAYQGYPSQAYPPQSYAPGGYATRETPYRPLFSPEY